MFKEIKIELIEIVFLAIIIFWSLLLCDISNRESVWQEIHQNRVYLAPEPSWPKDVPGQPLGYGNPNIGLMQSSEYWRDS